MNDGYDIDTEKHYHGKAQTKRVIERLEIVLDYIAEKKRRNLRVTPQLVDEVMGRSEPNRLIRMRRALGARQAREVVRKIIYEERLASLRQMERQARVANEMTYSRDAEPGPMMCSEEVSVYGQHSDGGLMCIIVDECLSSNNFAMLQAVSDHILKPREDEWNGFSELRKKIETAALQRMAAQTRKKSVSRKDFRRALARLFEEKTDDGRSLFSNRSDWVAVFRVAVDVGLVGENAYADFVELVNNPVMPSLPKPISKTDVSNAYSGIYTKPLKEWSAEAYLKQRTTNAVRLTYFYNKKRIADRLLNLLR